MNSNQTVFKHLMLDIETMGNESYSSITSIGALEFNIESGETGREFHVNVDLQSCVDIGLIMNASTIIWWLNREHESRIDLSLGQQSALPVKTALQSFTDFIGNNDYQIWANSPRFDCGILQNAYDKVGIPIPWDFRKERCVRTLVSFNPEIMEQYQQTGVKHNALADCYYQVEYCSATWYDILNSF